MKERGFWTLVAAPGLAVISWLLIFFLLDGGWVGATPSDGTTFAANSQVSADRSYVCGGVWVPQTVDSAGDVGRSTSLALAPAYPYTPHISYYDVTNDRLKYASLEGASWFTETVDLGGQHTSIALAPALPYTPCIAYYDYNGWDFGYACRNAEGWITDTIHHGMRVGIQGTPLALEPTYPYTPHIGTYNPHGEAQNLSHSYLSSTAWCTGTWVHEPVEPLLSQAGWHNSLALEPSSPYTPHMSYYARKQGDLRHAEKSNGTAWLTKTVDSAGDVGWYTSLALDSRGEPRISYYDATNADLKYARLTGTTWLSRPIDTQGDVGLHTSLELDQDDDPYICYYDATNDDLKLAYFNGAAWITKTVDSEGDVGAYCSLALDPLGCPHISYYDATNGTLKYAYLSPIKIYLPLVMRSYPPEPPYYYESPSLSANCSWTGVWGYVRTADRLPEANVQMRVGNWQGWRADTWTDADGIYGYLFADHPIAGDWFVQVFKGGQPSSKQMWWDTTANCTGAGARQEFRLDWRHR